MKKGMTIGIAKLRNLYDAHVFTILGELLEEAPRKRGTPRKYKLLKDLPTREQYKKLKEARYTTTLADLVSNAYSEAVCLRDELQDWYDNLPESFQSGDKGEQLQTAIDQLGECDSEPDLPEWLGEVQAVHYPALKLESRSDRCAEAVSSLEDAKAALDALEVEGEKKDEVEELCETLDTAISAWQDTEFPGMFG